MAKHLLSLTFKYEDKKPEHNFSFGHTKIVHLGTFEDLDLAIKEANTLLESLYKDFGTPKPHLKEVIGRKLFGVTIKDAGNTFWNYYGVSFRIEIQTIHDANEIPDLIKEAFAGVKRYREYKANENND